MPVGGLQGDPRVYRRLHLSEHAQQGLQPATQPGILLFYSFLCPYLPSIKQLFR